MAVTRDNYVFQWYFFTSLLLSTYENDLSKHNFYLVYYMVSCMIGQFKKSIGVLYFYVILYAIMKRVLAAF